MRSSPQCWPRLRRLGYRMNRGAITTVAKRKPRTPALIDRVRRHRVSIVICNAYLPADLVRLAKITALDRDADLRALSDRVDEVGDWPENVVPITGMSGVIAQVLRDHFATQSASTEEPTTKPKRRRAS